MSAADILVRAVEGAAQNYRVLVTRGFCLGRASLGNGIPLTASAVYPFKLPSTRPDNQANQLRLAYPRLRGTAFHTDETDGQRASNGPLAAVGSVSHRLLPLAILKTPGGCYATTCGRVGVFDYPCPGLIATLLIKTAHCYLQSRPAAAALVKNLGTKTWNGKLDKLHGP